MFVKFLLIVTSCYVLAPVSGDVLDDTELLMTFLVNRHGDRTPTSSQIYLSTDPQKLAEITASYGYGQLTEAGMRRGYAIGQFIRERYNDLLSPRYNRSEIYIRSTDYTRSKMTILSALAAIYPVVGKGWNPKINWTPVPFTTAQAIDDTNLAFVNCPTFTKTEMEVYTKSDIPELSEFSDLFEDLSANLGIDLTSAPVNVLTLEDTYACQMSLGLPLNEEAEKLWPRINDAANVAIKVVWGDERYLSMQAGVLIKQFHDLVTEVISGEDIPRVRILSSHDFNVYSLMAISNAIPSTLAIPRFGSVLGLELRKVVSTGKYVILVVFKETGDAPVQYLQVKGCDLLCDYDQFLAITSPYIINSTEWKSQCAWNEDLVVTIE